MVYRELFRTEKCSNDSMTGKCVLPSSQVDFVLKGTEICRELTIFEPVSPSSLVFSSQDFEEEIPKEVPKKVPPASDMELSGDASDVLKTKEGEEKPVPLPISPKSKTSLAEGELMAKANLCEFDKDLFSVPSVRVLDDTCMSFTNLQPVQPSIKEFALQDNENQLPEKTPRRLSLDSNLAPATSWECKAFTHSFIDESRFKLCKDIGVPNSLPSLFVLVTPNEEKQFGLENVKEICVSGIVFDKIIQSFEAPKSESFSSSECFLFAEICESNLALSHELIRKTFGNVQELNSVRKGCETLCCEDFWVLKPCDMNSALKKNVFGCLSKLDYEFALLELWFRNMHDLLRAKRRSEFEYVDTASKLAQSNMFASNYISLFGLCSKEKFYYSECSNTRMLYDHILDADSRNLNFVFKVLNLWNSFVYLCCTFDEVFLVFAKKQDKQVMRFVPRTRRTQGLDKQVDYGPKEPLFFLTWRPLATLQGEHIFDHTSNVFNLFSCVADELDLRSNPFKGGGDGAILERPEEEVKHLGHEKEQCNQMEMEHYKENVDYKGNLVQEEGEAHELVQGGEDPALERKPTAQEEVGEDMAQLEKPTSLFASKAQEEKLSNWWKGPITMSKAQARRKSITQVIWAWLRRKRKKPRRIKQLGLFNCCIFCN